jgi:hypothetical protein
LVSEIAAIAVEKALGYGHGFYKILSPNDTGETRSHQSGIYLPKEARHYFTENLPNKGENSDTVVSVLWNNKTEAKCHIKWYGAKKNEYRLTRASNQYKGMVGALFLIVREDIQQYSAFIISTDEDLDHVQASLGIDPAIGRSSLFHLEPERSLDDLAQTCTTTAFADFVDSQEQFPTTSRVSAVASKTTEECDSDWPLQDADTRLMKNLEAEYNLFRMLEHKFSIDDVSKNFTSVEEFLRIAQSIVQRRKSRAGYSLERHFEDILSAACIPFERQAILDGTRPDITIPSAEAYQDEQYELDKLFVVGVKTTCRDRWRQVIQEAPRVTTRFILTIQKGISKKQMEEMERAGVRLIVPASLHEHYNESHRDKILSVEAFIRTVRTRLGNI